MEPTLSFRAEPLAPDETAVDALARVSQLPKARIKDAMNKGAAWLKRGKEEKRLRRSSTVLRSGDVLTLYYATDILARTAPTPRLVKDERDYSVWDKPAGLLAQGTREGDHCSLLRLCEQQLKREVFLVHRLDREASGLMLIAHSRKAAAALSALFATQDYNTKLRKLYEVEVRGEVATQGQFDTPLDGKAALTCYTRLSYDAVRNASCVQVELVTGRKHQIRRHFAEAGFPVLGDPQYGKGNKDARGLQLRAMQLEFRCPLSGQPRCYRAESSATTQQ